MVHTDHPLWIAGQNGTGILTSIGLKVLENHKEEEVLPKEVITYLSSLKKVDEYIDRHFRENESKDKALVFRFNVALSMQEKSLGTATMEVQMWDVTYFMSGSSRCHACLSVDNIHLASFEFKVQWYSENHVVIPALIVG